MSEERTRRPDKIRPPMDITDRAKQFAPFAALGSMDGILEDVIAGRDVGDPEHILFFDDIEEMTESEDLIQ